MGGHFNVEANEKGFISGYSIFFYLRYHRSESRPASDLHLVQPPILSELAVEVERVEVVPAGSGSIEDHFLISYT